MYSPADITHVSSSSDLGTCINDHGINDQGMPVKDLGTNSELKL